MKKLVPFISLAGVLALLIVAIHNFSSRNERRAEASHPEKEAETFGSSYTGEAVTQFPEANAPAISVRARIKQLVDIADNAEMFDRTFQSLLAENSDEVFAYLNTVRFPDAGTDHAFNQIIFVAKNLDHYFRETSFDETLAELEAISGSAYLYDATLQEIISSSIGTHEGRDTPQYEQIYNWVKNNPDTVAGQNSGTVVGGMLYLSDPDNAWKKAMLLPEGRIRNEAMTTIMSQSYVDDVTQASEILNQIEMTPDLDPAVLNLVRFGLSQNSDPSILIDWATSITDMDLKLHSIEQTINAWQRHDPNELARWVEQASLDDQEIKPYLEIFHRQAQVNTIQAN